MQLQEHDPEKRPHDLKTVRQKLEHLRLRQTTPGVAIPELSNVARKTTFTSNNDGKENDEMTNKKPWALALIVSASILVMLVGVCFLIAKGVALGVAVVLLGRTKPSICRFDFRLRAIGNGSRYSGGSLRMPI